MDEYLEKYLNDGETFFADRRTENWGVVFFCFLLAMPTMLVIALYSGLSAWVHLNEVPKTIVALPGALDTLSDLLFYVYVIALPSTLGLLATIMVSATCMRLRFVGLFGTTILIFASVVFFDPLGLWSYWRLFD